MKIKLSLSLMLLSCVVFAQQKHFRSGDQKMLLQRGDVVRIDTDTAYVISSARAAVLNEKLDELVATRKSNEELNLINQNLLDKVKQVEELVVKLMQQIEADTEEGTADLEDVIGELDASLQVLKTNNLKLEENNKQLSSQIEQMDKTIKKLKKNIRGIWWNGVADKLVAGVIGVGIGMLIMVF